MVKFVDIYRDAEVWLETPEIVPATQVFDNVAIIGTTGTSCLLFKTSEGLILLDALNPGEYFARIIEDGIKSLGYDPTELKYLLISHGHPDHSGCGKILIEKYGCTPLLSKVDYDYEVEYFWEHPNPKWVFNFEISNFIEGGDVLRLGDTEIQVLSTPGHTPGGLSFLFDVYDQGKKHRAALWGGTQASPNMADINIFLDSLARYAKITQEQHVDVNLSNHPFMDSAVDRMATLRNRINPYVPNPFIMGEEGFQNYIKFYESWAGEVRDSITVE